MQKPIKIERIKKEREGEITEDTGLGLRLTFKNSAQNHIQEFPSSLLRDNCPCASCLQKKGDKSHDKPLSGRDTKKSSLLKVVSNTSGDAYDLKQVWLLGNYALGIKWGDGHDSGIYSYAFLDEIFDARKTSA